MGSIKIFARGGGGNEARMQVPLSAAQWPIATVGRNSTQDPGIIPYGNTETNLWEATHNTLHSQNTIEEEMGHDEHANQ